MSFIKAAEVGKKVLDDYNAALLDGFGTRLERFAKLVAEAECEACAELCALALSQNQEAINELKEYELMARCFIQGAITQVEKTSEAIKARSQS